MVHKEAKARIKINKLLEAAGWRFFDDANGRANIQLELHTKISQTQFDAFGENFESSQNGYVDFLLLNEKGHLFFEKFEETVSADQFIKENVLQGRWERVIEYMHQNVLERPEEFYTTEKLRKALGVDRRLSLREILEGVFGLISPNYKSADELLEEEFVKFIADAKPEDAASIVALKYYFKTYITDPRVREIIDSRRLTELNTNPTFTMQDYKAVPQAWRARIPEYVKDYIPLNQFMV